MLNLNKHRKTKS